MYAILETGGKQYKVQEGDVVFVEKLEIAQDDDVTFDKILAVSKDGDMSIGNPYLIGAKVTGKVISHGKEKKIIVFKYKAKKGYRKKQGHRQPYTKILIQSVVL